MLTTLLATQQNPDAGAAVVLLIVLGLAMMAGGLLYGQHERRKRREAEQRLGEVIQQARQQNQDGAERDTLMFAQHKQMNELHIAKLAAEVELLQNQVKSKSVDDDRIEASKEYHELMVEKTRLEIDSLRLHISEQRKRSEDWRLGDE